MGAILVNRVGVFKWPTQMVVILDAILVNQVEYLSGPLKWLGFCM
jgi:hypothetical protein